MWPAEPCITIYTLTVQKCTRVFVPLGVSLSARHLWGFCDRSWNRLRAPDDPRSSPKCLNSDQTHTYTFNHTHIPFFHIIPLQRRSSYSALALLCQRLALVIALRQSSAKDERKKVEKVFRSSSVYFLELQFSRRQKQIFVSRVCIGAALDNQKGKDKSESGLVLQVSTHFSQMQFYYWVSQRYSACSVSYRHRGFNNA